MSRVLVTGANGFIGSALASSLSNSGAIVYGLGAQPLDARQADCFEDYLTVRLPNPDVVDWLKSIQAKTVYHCAGCAHPYLSVREPRVDFESAVPVVFELLEGLRLGSPNTHFICLSSAAVYGQPVSLPVKESAEVAPVSPYGYHKRMTELLCEEFSSLYGIKTTAARIFSAFGPGLKKQVVWDTIKKFATAERAEFFGSGEETRDFLYIEDLVRAILQLDSRQESGFEIVNIASGSQVSIKEVVAKVAELFGRSREDWEFSGDAQPGTPRNWEADIGKLRAMGFQPSIPFDTGLEKTIHWAKGELGIQV